MDDTVKKLKPDPKKRWYYVDSDGELRYVRSSNPRARAGSLGDTVESYPKTFNRIECDQRGEESRVG